MTTFIIAEAGSSHDNDLQKAHRLIEAAKECGADAVKFQWTSDAQKMGLRRGVNYAMYYHYLEKPVSWLESLKAHADKVGIEFMCTVYLIEDIATIAPLVRRFKISAFESRWAEFLHAHDDFGKDVIASVNGGNGLDQACFKVQTKVLHCVSEYPTPIDRVNLKALVYRALYDGLSDHTANVLTGSAAVAAGARILEFHCRLDDTSPANPDYGHSHAPESMRQYIANVRTVERML